MPCGDSRTVHIPVNVAGAQVGDYLTLGACDPPLVRRPITADSSIRLRRPHVVIRSRKRSRHTALEVIHPGVVVQLGTGRDMAGIASDSRPGLRVAPASNTADALR